jgi:hypothetical protein
MSLTTCAANQASTRSGCEKQGTSLCGHFEHVQSGRSAAFLDFGRGAGLCATADDALWPAREEE